MTPSSLLDLAGRVERLTGPCRETDAEIARYLGWTLRPLSEVWVCYDHDNGSSALVWIMPEAPTYQYEGREYIDSGYYHHKGPPAFTASLDVAMTLCEPGAEISISTLYGVARVEYPLRHYRVGDILRLREWEPNTAAYSGREITKVVTFVLEGIGSGGITPLHGLSRGYAILSIAEPANAGKGE